jgi:hypothetical protein
MNGKPVFIGKKDLYSTIDMKGKPVLDAYNVDLRSMSTKYQPEVKSGFWSLDCFALPDTHD